MSPHAEARFWHNAAANLRAVGIVNHLDRAACPQCKTLKKGAKVNGGITECAKHRALSAYAEKRKGELRLLDWRICQ